MLVLPLAQQFVCSHENHYLSLKISHRISGEIFMQRETSHVRLHQTQTTTIKATMAASNPPSAIFLGKVRRGEFLDGTLSSQCLCGYLANMIIALSFPTRSAWARPRFSTSCVMRPEAQISAVTLSRAPMLRTRSFTKGKS